MAIQDNVEMSGKKAAAVVEEQIVVGPDGVGRRLADSDSDPLDRVPYWAALVTYFGCVSGMRSAAPPAEASQRGPVPSSPYLRPRAIALF